MAESESGARRGTADRVFDLCFASFVSVLWNGGGRRESVTLVRRVQAVSDPKPGDRMARERRWGLCPAAGVAHSLYPTPPAAADFLLTLASPAQLHRTKVTAGVTTAVSGDFRPAVPSAVTRFLFQEKYEMPLIPKQKREVKRPITIKLEQSLAERLNSYARCLESSRDHVVGSIVRYVMDRDKDFAAWMPTTGNAGEHFNSGTGKQQETAAKAGS